MDKNMLKKFDIIPMEKNVMKKNLKTFKNRKEIRYYFNDKISYEADY